MYCDDLVAGRVFSSHFFLLYAYDSPILSTCHATHYMIMICRTSFERMNDAATYETGFEQPWYTYIRDETDLNVLPVLLDAGPVLWHSNVRGLALRERLPNRRLLDKNIASEESDIEQYVCQALTPGLRVSEKATNADRTDVTTRLLLDAVLPVSARPSPPPCSPLSTSPSPSQSCHLIARLVSSPVETAQPGNHLRQ